MEDLHSAYNLLKHCFSFCKVAYFCRTVPPNFIIPALSYFDNRLVQVLENILAFPIDSHMKIQMSLAVSKGGLGIRNSSLHCYAAYLSSRKIIYPINLHSQNDWIDSSLLSLSKIIDPSLSITWSDISSQKSISMLIDSFYAKKLLSALPPFHQAAFLSYSAPKASAWLSSIPNKALNLHLDTKEFRILMAVRLRYPLPSSTKCPSCNKKCLDSGGFHALTCSSKGDITRRHNQIRNYINATASSAGF